MSQLQKRKLYKEQLKDYNLILPSMKSGGLSD